MNLPFIGQMVCVPYRECPPNWLFCRGQLLPIADYQPLHSLIGSVYGGDGKTTFALPDLRGRVPVGAGQGPDLPGYALGDTMGLEVVWLEVGQTPAHFHLAGASSAPGAVRSPAAAVVAPGSPRTASFARSRDGGAMNRAMIEPSPTPTEGHENRQPFLVLNWIIATAGIYPVPGRQRSNGRPKGAIRHAG